MFGGQVFSVSHRGTVRSENQDALVCRPDMEVYAVADGAGGTEDGRAAADTVIRNISRISPTAKVTERLDSIQRAITTAHECLLRNSRAASTVAVLMLDGPGFVCLWLGDSRIYLWRDGELVQLTHDHSMVQEMVDAGTLTPAEARAHPGANVITRAVGGIQGNLLIAEHAGKTLPGDRFLLCSDGLTKTIEDDEICRLMGRPGDIAAAMLDLALQCRARDNVSAIVVCRD